MKKIITLCSIIVAAAIIITCFAACDGNTEDNTTTEPTTEIVSQTGKVDGINLTATIEEDCVLLKNGDDVFQKLNYPIKKNFEIDFDMAKSNFKFLDMNFDGLADFYVAVGEKDGNVEFFCWLYNATDKKFDYSISLSSLKNISVDADEQLIYSSDSGFYYEYGWVDGELKVVTSYNKNETVPEKITQASNDLVSNKNDNTTSASNTQAGDTVVDTSGNVTTTENAPQNTTTTAPVTKGKIEVITETLPENEWA